MMHAPGDQWVTGDAYEAYMGRWSRQLARAFVEWLPPKPGANWLDVGCGTGALTSTICDCCQPASVVACDPSEPFIEHARKNLSDVRASFVVAGVDTLPRRDGGFDDVVSGLVLNFLPDPGQALRSMREHLRPGGTVGAYVWDYATGMELLLCRPPALASLFRDAGLADIEVHPLDISTDFATFGDYWTPFLRGTGPAPSYVASLDPGDRELLRERLRQRLQAGTDGRLHLSARAWAVRGISN